jgi:AmiR/NasT family two-component response regulator
MLADDQLADALALADIATETILALQSDAEDDAVADQLGGVGSERIVVHQATGMVAAQAATDVEAALAWLRAHAFAVGRPLHDVAGDVVARRLRFSP